MGDWLTEKHTGCYEEERLSENNLKESRLQHLHHLTFQLIASAKDYHFYTGVDFAGPLFINNPPTGQRGKAYCSLFTCASTRALHLELTESLTVASFLQALRRFTSRWELPSRLLTDIVKTFKSASDLWHMCLMMKVGSRTPLHQRIWYMVVKLPLSHPRNIMMTSVHLSRTREEQSIISDYLKVSLNSGGRSTSWDCAKPRKRSMQIANSR